MTERREVAVGRSETLSPPEIGLNESRLKRWLMLNEWVTAPRRTRVTFEMRNCRACRSGTCHRTRSCREPP